MAKRRTFEELLGKEFRWPMPGDDPFDVHDDDENPAQLAGDDFSRFVLMAEGYRRSEVHHQCLRASCRGRSCLELT